MDPLDLLRQVLRSLAGQALRSTLTALGIVVGVAAVILLTAVGEGTRRGIAAQFTQFGTTLLSVMPGKNETMGVGALVGSSRPLTLGDARALARIPGVRAMTANVYGVARVKHGDRGRDVYVYGVLPAAEEVWHWGPALGSFLPPGDPDQAPAVAVLGEKLAREIFGRTSPLGKRVRIGQTRFRVVGVMSRRGRFLGMDLDDTAIVPLQHARRLFNLHELHEINLDVADHAALAGVERRVKELMLHRHRGREDFTVVTQDAMLEIVDKVLSVVTGGVVAIAAIALVVGAVGILTLTWVGVNERRGEIGLLKALGASRGQILLLFLGEAGTLGALGGGLGVVLGLASGYALHAAVPAVEIHPAPGSIPLAVGVSLAVGLLAGWLPARRASALDPVTALREE